MMSAIRESQDTEEGAKEETADAGTGKAVRRITLRPYLALAAAIVGFALLATVIIRVVTADRAAARFEDENSLYADLAAEELDIYMIENELFMAEQAEITDTEQTISSEAIIDYLMTEDIDLNDIYELL